MGLSRAIDLALRRTGLLGRMQEVWRRDVDRASSKLRRDAGADLNRIQKSMRALGKGVAAGRSRVHALEQRLEGAERTLATMNGARVKALERSVAQLVLASNVNDRQAHLLTRFGSRIVPSDVLAHITGAALAAQLDPFPCAHLVIDQVFPADFYELLVESLPAPEFFPSRDPIKMNLRPSHFKVVPALTRRAWEFIDADVTRTITAVALPRLRPYLRGRYGAMFGPANADATVALPHRAFGGRIMLRRPGYLQKPHLDPKRSSATVLIYVARPGDPEGVGTALYALSGPVSPVRTSTYYPEDDGITCTPVKHVPFRPNTAVVFVNADGAHGAEISEDSAPEGFQRYAFMYYIGPDVPELLRLVSRLSAADQQGWLGLAEWSDD